MTIHLQWAYAYRNGYKRPKATGLYYRYFETKQEAELSRFVHLKRGRYAGEIEHRPGESWAIRYGKLCDLYRNCK